MGEQMAGSKVGEDLANAYRSALREGRARFGNSKTELAILRAIVAASAAATAHRIRTEMNDGAAVAQPLTDLVPDLRQGDYVGATLDAIKGTLIKEAKSLVLTGALTKGALAVCLAVVAFVVGRIMPGLFAAGQTTGAGLVAGFISLLSLGGAGIYMISRAGYAIGESARNAYNQAQRQSTNRPPPRGKIGAGAKDVFDQTVRPTLVRSVDAADVDRLVNNLLLQVRGGVGAIAWGSIALLFAGLAYFGYGLLEGGYNYWMSTQSPIPTHKFTPARQPSPYCERHPLNSLCR
ncbi:hypothetical protein MMUC44124_17030 [Mycolicibacterium mucogenicum DSM 44124]|uniref:Uncharacterized protein n=2 Tax=Mycolicibacterium mucogenicum DSM 44124 TaxID=1226753 RepID=A0A8H2PJ05_MYCMU|nr:hypothetical protein MMUC44124_17030 [Mycolicibacterium mucogenicum DSM 44124]